jgi:hypothetical protein
MSQQTEDQPLADWEFGLLAGTNQVLYFDPETGETYSSRPKIERIALTEDQSHALDFMNDPLDRAAYLRSLLPNR